MKNKTLPTATGIQEGLYDLLKTHALAKGIEESRLGELSEPLLEENSHWRLAEALAEQVSQILAVLKDGEGGKVEAQLSFINDLLGYVHSRHPATSEVDRLLSPAQSLRALHRGDKPPELPAIGLAQPWLFTAGKDSPALLHELKAELGNCDHVDILVSFITVSGVRKIIDTLRQITSTDAQGRSRSSIRVITTTYIGATEQKALDMLAQLPHCQVRVSLDGRRTRLHAKAWIFQRASGFGSAYVGSANLSGAALMGGLEWTVKFTEKGQPNLFHRAAAHFETLWQDGEFQPYHPDDPHHQQALSEALRRESGQDLIATPTFFDIQAKPFQAEILEQLASEREHGRLRNLLVAATGTGKTVMAALDYRRLAQQHGGQPRLLFVAHRRQLLQQALRTYRQILRDQQFGEVLAGSLQPARYEHLFATVQSLQSRQIVSRLGADYWQVVVIDECHHIVAQSFEQLMQQLRPRYLLGLTATPERSDGKSILSHFDNRPDGSPAAQLRLWQALDLQLLAPFEYYACDDETDYRDIPWRRQDESAALDNLLTGNTVRARAVIDAWHNLVADPARGKTLAFCVSIAHAHFMAAEFNRAGLRSEVVTGQTPLRDRLRYQHRLARGELHILVTADLYNEGVDLPYVDTLLLLRPTQSVTLFQQQIGRGLRLHPEKESCLILDFVGQHRADFRFDALYGAISGLSRREVLEGIEQGFGRLPSGCHLQLQKQARENILSSLRNVLNQGWRQLQQELRAYSTQQGTMQPSLHGFLHDQQLDLADIYRSTNSLNSGWTNLKRSAGLLSDEAGPEESYFSRRLASLCHIDDSEQLQLIKQVAEAGAHYSVAEPNARVRLQMLAYQIDGQTRQTGTVESFLARLAKVSVVCEELGELAEYLDARTQHIHQPLPGLEDTPLKLHASYQQREILTAVGFLSSEKRPPFRAGVLPLKERRVELLFVTLDKSTALHEGVAYNDYAISPELFHWQSQNTASPATANGRRYLESPHNGWRFQLFVRSDKGAPYYACGPVQFVDSHSERPMNIRWRLEKPLPMRLFKVFGLLA
jgi:superfamily II DNA or RNA helicase/HKD family nuclease